MTLPDGTTAGFTVAEDGTTLTPDADNPAGSSATLDGNTITINTGQTIDPDAVEEADRQVKVELTEKDKKPAETVLTKETLPGLDVDDVTEGDTTVKVTPPSNPQAGDKITVTPPGGEPVVVEYDGTDWKKGDETITPDNGKLPIPVTPENVTANTQITVEYEDAVGNKSSVTKTVQAKPKTAMPELSLEQVKGNTADSDDNGKTIAKVTPGDTSKPFDAGDTLTLTITDPSDPSQTRDITLTRGDDGKWASSDPAVSATENNGVVEIDLGPDLKKETNISVVAKQGSQDPSEPTEAETVGTDKTNLNDAINNTPEIPDPVLTPEEQAVKDALDEAKKITDADGDNKDASQKEIEEAARKLNDAVRKLQISKMKLLMVKEIKETEPATEAVDLDKVNPAFTEPITKAGDENAATVTLTVPYNGETFTWEIPVSRTLPETAGNDKTFTANSFVFELTKDGAAPQITKGELLAMIKGNID